MKKQYRFSKSREFIAQMRDVLKIRKFSNSKCVNLLNNGNYNAFKFTISMRFRMIFIFGFFFVCLICF